MSRDTALNCRLAEYRAGASAVLSAPCVLGCDAGQVMRSLATA
jgi:hypothetical protein